MKTIGMLGGMSWESTAIYYKEINEYTRNALGGLHSAKICLYSADFEEISGLQHRGQWSEMIAQLSRAAQFVEAGGANFIIICTNTMHKIASEIEAVVSIPLLHIADATAAALVTDNITRVGLLGTGFTMRESFYKDRLAEKFGIDVIVPQADQQKIVHDIIYSELCVGIIRDESRQQYLNIINQLHDRGAEAIILGCTEIVLLVQQEHSSVPLYDTAKIHAVQAAKLALSE